MKPNMHVFSNTIYHHLLSANHGDKQARAYDELSVFIKCSGNDFGCFFFYSNLPNSNGIKYHMKLKMLSRNMELFKCDLKIVHQEYALRFKIPTFFVYLFKIPTFI